MARGEGLLWGHKQCPCPLSEVQEGAVGPEADLLIAVTCWSTMSSPRLALGFSSLMVKQGPGWMASHCPLQL